ncbi:MAG: S26 family signal peptidase, partial [Myxococcota bacterium]
MIPIRPPLAMVLALFLPGAGHLYAGWPRRAVLFAALLPATLVLLCVATATRALSVSAFVPLVFVVPIVLQVIAAVDAGRRASTPILAPNRVSNRGVVVGFALGSLAVTLFTAMVLEGTTLSARRMSSATMTPSLLVGDYVVVRRPAFITAIAQGDILEFRFPRDPRFTYLQRVMGTGNQLVSFEAPDPKTPPSVDGLDRLWSRAQAESWQSADCTVRAGEVVDETIP